MVATKGDIKTLENPSKAMARWMRQYPSLFPKGSDQGHNTKALPTIWSDMAGFEKAANDTADAADKMAQLAKAGDADGYAAEIKVLGDTCTACHRTSSREVAGTTGRAPARPGVAPVYLPCSNTGTPDTRVAS